MNPDTGAIVGICDWRNAEISPFGMSQGSGDETMLGIRTVNNGYLGWSYFLNQQELRNEFWTTLYQCFRGRSEARVQRIEVARLVGLCLTNGFVEDRYRNMVAATDESVDLRFLGAVVFD
jgi:hypothetical protein